MSFIENSAFCTSNACPERPRRVPRGEARRKAGNRHVRFEERGWETGRWPKAPELPRPSSDSTEMDLSARGKLRPKKHEVGVNSITDATVRVSLTALRRVLDG